MSTRRRFERSAIGAIAVALLIECTTALPSAAQQGPAEIGGGHFAAPDPAELAPAAAESIYRELFEQMVGGYRLSDHPAARNYPRWRRYNGAPYRSATHGRRFVNNYANATADAYGRFEAAGPLPPGAVIAKDTFYVGRDGARFPGALMIMEKREAGFNASTGDWRYTMIMPDGSVFGETDGINAEGMVFCVNCHAAAAKNDHLFFMPPAFRAGR